MCVAYIQESTKQSPKGIWRWFLTVPVKHTLSIHYNIFYLKIKRICTYRMTTRADAYLNRFIIIYKNWTDIILQKTKIKVL